MEYIWEFGMFSAFRIVTIEARSGFVAQMSRFNEVFQYLIGLHAVTKGILHDTSGIQCGVQSDKVVKTNGSHGHPETSCCAIDEFRGSTFLEQ